MIPIEFDPTSLTDPEKQQFWTAWLARAERATARAVSAFEDWLPVRTEPNFKFEFDNDVWKDLKNWLLKNVFYQKCAYCERKISGAHGDAEHYRPKGAVKTGSKRAMCQIPDPVNGGDLPLAHPGYFWLAYDWRNLLPACEFCNSGHGKNERFDNQNGYIALTRLSQAEYDALPRSARPLPSKKWPGFYYPTPASLDAAERPLLLNPLNAPPERNPRKHLCFGVRGIVAAVDNSPLGQNSIEVFQLEDEDLRQERQEAQEDFWDDYSDAMRKFKPQDPASYAAARQLLKEYRAGAHPFSAAALDYQQYVREAEKAMLAEP